MYISHDEVVQVDAALRDIDEAWMRVRYDALKDTDYDRPSGDEDFAYTWETSRTCGSSSRRPARAGRAVLFTVDP